MSGMSHPYIVQHRQRIEKAVGAAIDELVCEQPSNPLLFVGESLVSQSGAPRDQSGKRCQSGVRTA